MAAKLGLSVRAKGWSSRWHNWRRQKAGRRHRLGKLIREPESRWPLPRNQPKRPRGQDFLTMNMFQRWKYDYDCDFDETVIAVQQLIDTAAVLSRVKQMWFKKWEAAGKPRDVWHKIPSTIRRLPAKALVQRHFQLDKLSPKNMLYFSGIKVRNVEHVWKQ